MLSFLKLMRNILLMKEFCNDIISKS